MKTYRVFLLFLAFALILTIGLACNFPTLKGNGDVITQQRDAVPFVNLETCCGIDVYITQANTYSIAVTTDANLQDKIKTTVSNSTLVISTSGSHHFTKARVDITVPNLRKIKSSSSADVFSAGELHFDNLILEATSGSDIKLDVFSKFLKCSASSGSDIKLKGKTDVLLVDISSGADFEGVGLVATDGKIKASSGADATVRITGEAEFDASSGSDIKYIGQPQNITRHSSSGADIKQKGGVSE
jgi:hypothetical protein